MNHASVFSGIGGPEVAAAMLGWENLFHCEINPFGRAILEYWFPNSVSYDDITKTDFSEWRGKVDVLTGGFPCQPFSYAGQRRGEADDRYLWPFMFKCIDQIRPTWVVAENVAGITTMVEQGKVTPVESQTSLFGEGNEVRRYELRETFTLQRICNDLEQHGYSVQPVLIPACAVGAPHRRDRVFIIARRVAADSRSCGQSASELESERERTEVQQQIGEQSQHGACGQSNARLTADTTDNGLQHRPEAGGQGSETGEIQRQGHCPERNIPTPSAGGGWVAPDTNGERLERTAGLRVQGYEGRGQSDGIRECPRQSGKDGNTGIVSGYTGPFGSTYGAWSELPEESGVSAQCETEPRRVCAGIGQDDRPVGERWRNFPSVSPVHRGNDGLPFDVDRLTISFSKWRTESLKAYGNAIVPQVMYEIFRAIEIIEE